ASMPIGPSFSLTMSSSAPAPVSVDGYHPPGHDGNHPIRWAPGAVPRRSPRRPDAGPRLEWVLRRAGKSGRHGSPGWEGGAGGVRAVELVVLLVTLATVVAAFAGRLRVPAPSLLVAAGLAVGLLPGAPMVHVPPAVVSLVVLPPLLYAASEELSWRDLRA